TGEQPRKIGLASLGRDPEFTVHTLGEVVSRADHHHLVPASLEVLDDGVEMLSVDEDHDALAGAGPHDERWSRALPCRLLEEVGEIRAALECRVRLRHGRRESLEEVGTMLEGVGWKRDPMAPR